MVNTGRVLLNGPGRVGAASAGWTVPERDQGSGALYAVQVFVAVLCQTT